MTPWPKMVTVSPGSGCADRRHSARSRRRGRRRRPAGRGRLADGAAERVGGHHSLRRDVPRYPRPRRRRTPVTRPARIGLDRHRRPRSSPSPPADRTGCGCRAGRRLGPGPTACQIRVRAAVGGEFGARGDAGGDGPDADLRPAAAVGDGDSTHVDRRGPVNLMTMQATADRPGKHKQTLAHVVTTDIDLSLVPMHK